jgi:hypothetical protein
MSHFGGSFPPGYGGAGGPQGPGEPEGGGTPGPNPKPNDMGTFSQQLVRQQPVSARVPDRVAGGVMATGVIVLDSPTEFVVDFMQGLARPLRVAARVVMAPPVMEQFVNALRDNIAKFEQRYGAIPPLPKPPTDRRPTIQEIYDEFKLADEILSGSYANAVMVGHSASEFFLDFITNFFPTSAVSCRVFVSSTQMPRVLDAMGTAFARFKQRVAQHQQQHLLKPQPPQTQQPTEPPAAKPPEQQQGEPPPGGESMPPPT